MISGVLFILFGEALLLLSRPHFVWALIFLGMNILVIPLFEEPDLRRRFGDAYVEYCRHVPRLFPRLRPWEPEDPVLAAPTAANTCRTFLAWNPLNSGCLFPMPT